MIKFANSYRQLPRVLGRVGSDSLPSYCTKSGRHNISSRQLFHTTSFITKDRVSEILVQYKDGLIDLEQAQRRIADFEKIDDNAPVLDSLLQSFATLDHDRWKRTGFPEAVFGEGKTAQQIAIILESMALKINQQIQSHKNRMDEFSVAASAVLVTR
jgi:hypothetical protein